MSKLKEEIEHNITGRVAIRNDEIDLFLEYATLAGNFVDVGTLWGGSALLAWKNKKTPGKVFTLDTLESMYFITGDPRLPNSPKSSRKAITDNFRKFGADIRLIIGKSSDVKLPTNITTVFIDGDHSFEGLESDWNVFKLRGVKYAMFHDYNPKKDVPGAAYEPEVGKFVDTVVRQEQGWKEVGRAGTLIVFERIQ